MSQEEIFGAILALREDRIQDSLFRTLRREIFKRVRGVASQRDDVTSVVLIRLLKGGFNVEPVFINRYLQQQIRDAKRRLGILLRVDADKKPHSPKRAFEKEKITIREPERFLEVADHSGLAAFREAENRIDLLHSFRREARPAGGELFPDEPKKARR